MKQKVNFKRNEWPQFNSVFFDAIKEQEKEFEKAVFCQGEYKMVDECLDLQVTHLEWIQMNFLQRKSRIEKAQKAKVHKDSHVALTGSSSTQRLSIKLGDAQISLVSKGKLKSMWEKAEELLSGDGFVLPAAGAKCDCPVYRSSPHVCQHALAAADDIGILDAYLQWLRKTKKGLNISRLIDDKIPNDAGKKTSTRRKGAPQTKKKQSPRNICNPLSDSNSATSFVSESAGIASPSNSCTLESSMSSGNLSSISHSSFPISPYSSYPSACNMYPPPYNYHPPPYNTFLPAYNAYYHSPYNANCSSQPYHASSNFFSHTNYGVPGIQPTLPVPPSIQMLPPVSHTQSSDYDDDSSQGNPVFILQKLSGKIRKCYGCTSNIREEIRVPRLSS